ncbi:MAG: patatin-like phospholipase family protein [Deinococcales bacterium]
MESASDEGRLGLVLSGGGARGFAHIGVLRVLEREGVHFDVIAGTSMGAVLGALYASGRRAEDLFRLADTTSWREVVDLSLQTGLFKGDRLEAFLAAHLPGTFQDLEVPLAVTTTESRSSLPAARWPTAASSTTFPWRPPPCWGLLAPSRRT